MDKEYKRLGKLYTSQAEITEEEEYLAEFMRAKHEVMNISQDYRIGFGRLSMTPGSRNITWNGLA